MFYLYFLVVAFHYIRSFAETEAEPVHIAFSLPQTEVEFAESFPQAEVVTPGPLPQTEAVKLRSFSQTEVVHASAFLFVFLIFSEPFPETETVRSGALDLVNCKEDYNFRFYNCTLRKIFKMKSL